MSYADDIFCAMCADIIENGTTTEGQKVRPHWEDGTPAYTIDVYKRQDLDTLLGERLEVVERGRPLAGQVRAAVVEEHRRGQLVLLRDGIDEGLHEVAAELVGARAHGVGEMCIRDSPCSTRGHQGSRG